MSYAEYNERMNDNKCDHEWDDGERDNGPYSYGYGIIAYIYTCQKCGDENIIEKDVL